MKYNEIVTQYFFHPCHIGAFDITKKNIGAATVYAKTYAASIQLHIAIDNDDIKDTAIKVKGCPYTIAAACFIADTIINLPIASAAMLNAREIAKALDLPDAKFYAALLAEDSIKTAIKNYQLKNER